MTKTQLIQTLQQGNPSLTKHDITGVLDSLSAAVRDGLKTDGVVVIPDVVKLKTVMRPATPEKQGVNPFTKQPITIAAKPESKKIKVTATKQLREALGA